jgi:CheY-like chemotaxis protein
MRSSNPLTRRTDFRRDETLDAARSFSDFKTGAAAMNPTRKAVCLLVVEDEGLIRLLLATELEQSGFEVLATDSASAALEAVRNSPEAFQALVTEVELDSPLSGFDVARRCREVQPQMPVVYIDGGCEQLFQREGEPGAVLLSRPSAASRLVGVLCELFDPPERPLESGLGEARL